MERFCGAVFGSCSEAVKEKVLSVLVEAIGAEAARIRVRSVDEISVNDFSDPFSVFAGFVVETPHDGSIGLATMMSVEWATFGVAGNVQISLHENTDAKQHRRNLVLSTPNTGSFTWIVVGSTSTAIWYVVRVRSVDDNSIRAFSGPVTFFNPVRVISPNGGEQVQIGSQVDVRWTAPGVGLVKVALCKGTSFYKDIVEETENDGHFLWTVPDSIETSYTGYTIRVRSIDEISVNDFSDAPITISQ